MFSAKACSLYDRRKVEPHPIDAEALGYLVEFLQVCDRATPLEGLQGDVQTDETRQSCPSRWAEGAFLAINIEYIYAIYF